MLRSHLYEQDLCAKLFVRLLLMSFLPAFNQAAGQSPAALFYEWLGGHKSGTNLRRLSTAVAQNRSNRSE
jgi:hypothetical protein